MRFRFCLIVLLWATILFAAEGADSSSWKTELENRFSFVGIFLPHQSLRNSESLHKWPFFLTASPMGWNTSLRAQRNFGKWITPKASLNGDLFLFGLGIRSDLSFEFLHLLEVGVQGNVSTAINYGSVATFMGTYNPEKKDYDCDAFMTRFLLGVNYHATLSIPLMAFLPKTAWTKWILKPGATLTYMRYTGADDGEVWKVGMEIAANGYSWQYGATFICLLPFAHFPMAMVSYGGQGIMHKSDYDAVYDPYDPEFKRIHVTPRLAVKLNENWAGMLMTVVSRNRKYRNVRYESNQELLQERTGHEWMLSMIMFVISRKF